jgi:hypothetical protein
LPLWFFTGTADLLIRMSMGALAKRSSETVRNHRNAVRDGQESARKAEQVVLELLRSGNDWRIADVAWESGTLRALYRHAAHDGESVVR